MKTDREIQEANDEWRMTFDAMDEAVALLDAEGRILRCNKAMAVLINKPFSEIIGLICKEICICLGGHREECPFNKCRRTLKRERSAFNRKEQWFEVSADPILDRAGQFQGVVHIIQNITEQKQLEDALRKSEEKFRYFFESANDSLFIVDMKGRLIDVNRTAYERLGYSREEMLEKYVSELDTAEFAAKVPQRMAQIAESGRAVFESAHITKDGTVIPVEINAIVIDYAGQKLVLSVIRDITERRMAEDAIRMSEERYRSVVENAFDMVQSIAPEGRFLYVNPAWLRTMGYSWEELRDMKIFDIIHPSCLSKCSNVFSSLSSGLPVERFESQFTARDGRVIDVEGSASVHMVDGKVKSVQCLLHDVTERKRLTEELFRSQQDWEYTFNSITDMVTVHDKEYNIILANKAAEKILGLPIFDNMKERKCFAYYHGTAQAPAGCPSCGCLSSGVSASFEIFEPHLNMFIEIRAIPRFDSSGNLIGLIHIVRDITERKKADSEHERLYHEKELLHEQLLQSQKMEAVGTLAGGIAHDFNNILNVIMGYGGLLENMPGMTGKAKEFLFEITSAANRAAYLTRGLLAFSRKQHLELKPADLNDIIRSITGMLHRIIGEDIRMNIALSEDRLVTICDSGQVEQIVVNLATNARDAMPGGGELTIKTEIVELDEEFCGLNGFGIPGRYVVMRLTDTGGGMNEETKERIFEPFFTTKPVGKGTGLGLSIIYGIVTQHQGFLECKSRPGHGTVFSVYLPLAVTAQSAEEKNEAREYVARGRGELILIAEDDESGRRLLRVVLEHQGYRVIEAVNGIDVIEKFSEHSQEIALMLLDVIMPDMSGYDALRLIKQQVPDAKAILMSGYTADILAEKGIQDVANPLLKKPVSPHELLTLVRSTLDMEHKQAWIYDV